VNKWPKVLIFSMLGAAGTVLNTVLLLALLFRGSPPSSTGASAQNDPSAQAVARHDVCLLMSSHDPPDSPLSDLMARFHCTREDAEALLRTAGEDQEAHRFRCSPTGAVE